ncbi:metallophosphoesterase, partial [Candidatus Woesearchaeota archaeon]|nr:metallophosphoesterase [Candidatus Woesearchaeota archaeon]
FYPKKLATAIREINRLKPEAVIVTGDLTLNGYEKEFAMAKKALSKIKAKTLIIPGNHDSRLCGDEIYNRMFGIGNQTLDLPGINIIGIDTSIPDLDEGHVGRGRLKWLLEEIGKRPKDNLTIIAMHHHLISIPKTGRERSTISDAGDVLAGLINSGVDLVLCGHKHTPHSWYIDGMAIVNAGSACAVKLRASISNSYNIIRIYDGTIEIMLKEPGKKATTMVEYKTAMSEQGTILKRKKRQ